MTDYAGRTSCCRVRRPTGPVREVRWRFKLEVGAGAALQLDPVAREGIADLLICPCAMRCTM